VSADFLTVVVATASRPKLIPDDKSSSMNKIISEVEKDRNLLMHLSNFFYLS
jgi:hypothetical protein